MSTKDTLTQSSKPNKVIYYDGNCPMCTAFVGALDTSSKREVFSLKDVHQVMLPEGFTSEAVLKEMHVVGSDGVVYKNAEAILYLLEEYPLWRPLVKVGRLPGIKQMLPVGYNFVARNRLFLFGQSAPLYWLKVVVSLGLLSSVFLSIPLWVRTVYFPPTPIFSWLPTLPVGFEWWLLCVLGASLLATLVSARPQRYIWVAVATLTVFTLFDQMRLQPWVWQYVWMLALLGLFSWRAEDVSGRQSVLQSARIVVAGIYFYSGLQKANIYFVGTVFPWMLEPITRELPSEYVVPAIAFGFFVPLIEMAIGLGLLLPRFRKVAIVGALCMLVLVLVTLGPWGHAWNSVVWPWNIAMMLLVLILFYRTEPFTFKDVCNVRGFFFHKVLILIFIVLPALSFFNLWDSYLSYSLYSGNTDQAIMYFTDAHVETLPNEVKGMFESVSMGSSTLLVGKWSFTSLNVPVYPEARVYRNIFSQLCSFSPEPDGTLEIFGKQTIRNFAGNQWYTCGDLD